MNHKAARKELQENSDYRFARTICGNDIEKRYIVTMDARITCPSCMECVIAELDFKVIALKEILQKLQVNHRHSEFINHAQSERLKLARHTSQV